MLSRLSNRKSTSPCVVFTSTLTFSVHVPASRPYILNLSLFSRLFNHHASPSLSRWQSGLSLLFSYPTIHLFLSPSSLLVPGHRWTPPPPHRPTPTPSPLLLIVPMSRSHSRCSKLMKVFRIVIPEIRPRSHPDTDTHTHTHGPTTVFTPPPTRWPAVFSLSESISTNISTAAITHTHTRRQTQ